MATSTAVSSPGPELNIEIAKLLGWTEIEWRPENGGVRNLPVGIRPDERPSPYTGYRPKFQIPDYSRDIAAAWEVVGKIQSTGWCFELKSWGDKAPQGPKILVYLWKEWITQNNKLMHGNGLQVLGDTAPHAICLAALKALSARASEDTQAPQDRPSSDKPTKA